MGHQHGQVGAVEDPLGEAAEHHLAQPAVAVAAHHQQRRTEFAGRFEQHLDRGPPGTTLAAIADVMEDKRVKRLPVLDGDTLVGIVSRSNLLRTLASTAPASPAGTAVDDAAIRIALVSELSGQTWSRRADNSVVVSDGVVHLWGLVTTREEQRALELAAKGVAGVKAVQSHMIVLSEEPYPLFPGALMV